MRLLAALEMLAALADPFLPFQDNVGELIADFRGEKFQQAQAEKEVDLDILVILGLGQGTLQKLRQQLAKRHRIRPSRGARLHAGKMHGTGALADQVEEVIAGRLDELRAEEDVVMNIVDADRQRPHGDGDAIALQVDSGPFRRAEYGEFVGHVLQPEAFAGPFPKVTAGPGPGKEPKGQA